MYSLVLDPKKQRKDRCGQWTEQIVIGGVWNTLGAVRSALVQLTERWWHPRRWLDVCLVVAPASLATALSACLVQKCAQK
eukprot:2357148-Amphidinium_carterae.1